jgi:hypothetical protein
MPEETYRFSWGWRAMGVFFAALGLAVPASILADDGKLNFAQGLIGLALVTAGIWCYVYYAKYAISLTPDGFTLYRFAREPFVVRWRDVTSVRQEQTNLIFETSDRRKIAISTWFEPGFDAIAQAAARHVSADVAAGVLPEIEPELVSAEQRRLQHFVAYEMWRAIARRGVIFGSACVAAGFAADFVESRINFKALPQLVAMIVRFVIVVLGAMGYRLGAVLIGFAILYFIMALQEFARLRRLPP